ncbi:Hypothetical protein HVPorG_04790 [Roseomonas mucosa]|nr:Hypothetical protein HVPorG_04790 [Roseomonas mucosa]
MRRRLPPEPPPPGTSYVPGPRLSLVPVARIVPVPIPRNGCASGASENKMKGTVSTPMAPTAAVEHSSPARPASASAHSPEQGTQCPGGVGVWERGGALPPRRP